MTPTIHILNFRKKIVLLLWVLLFSGTSQAVKRPHWEWGWGYFEGVTPHYSGSNHYHRIRLPLPYFNYRTEEIQLGDRNIFYLWKNQ